MCVIAHAHTSTRTTTIAHVISVYDNYCLGHWNEENERKKKKNSNLMVDHLL